MKPRVLLSHGSDSGPQATKVSALAAVAEALEFPVQSLDYRDLDARGQSGSVQPRIERLLAAMRQSQGPVLLAGSSMGAFVSALASTSEPCAGLFLLALPVGIPGFAQKLDMARDVPVSIVHGFSDELCPADAAVAFARERDAHIHLVADGHRLSEHVDWIAQQFRLFLERY